MKRFADPIEEWLQEKNGYGAVWGLVLVLMLFWGLR